jgi:glycerol-3-phosphate acyltransferase PlsY
MEVALVTVSTVIFLVLGYALGSVPIAYLVARSRGVDVFNVGTGNPGGANVFRKVGRSAGVAVVLGDAGKSVIPAAVVQWVGASWWVALAVGVAAMVGHWYPVFLRFRGGAGLAPAIGASYALMTLPCLLATPAALIVLYLSKNVAVAAVIWYALLLVSALLLGQPLPLVLTVTGLPVLVLVRRYLLPTLGEGVPGN